MGKYLIQLVLIGMLIFGGSIQKSEAQLLSKEELADLYIEVLKDSILKRNLNIFFTYRENGEVPKFKPNFVSIKKSVVKGSATLNVNYSGLSNAPLGIVADLANNYSVKWVNVELKKGQERNIEGTDYKVYNNFVQDIFNNAPYIDFESPNKREVFSQKIQQLIDPSMPLENKINLVKAIQEYDEVKRVELLQLIDVIYEELITHKTIEIAKGIRGGIAKYRPLTLAAGLKNSKKEGNFFREYAFEFDEQDKPMLESINDPIRDSLLPSNKFHFRLWGMQKTQQSTIAIKRGKNIYFLYSNDEATEITADSTFTNATYFTLKDKMEYETIPGLEDEIHRKDDGFLALKKHYDEQLRLLTIDIQKKEFELIESRMKKRKKNINKRNGPIFSLQVKGDKKIEAGFVMLSNQHSTAKKYKREADEKLRKARLKVTECYFVLKRMNANLAGNQQVAVFENDIYLFSDGSTFNPKTQIFTFTSPSDEILRLTLLAIDQDILIKYVQENKLIVTMHD